MFMESNKTAKQINWSKIFWIIMVVNAAVAGVVVCLYFFKVYQIDNYVYRTQIIELENSNFLENIWVVNYVCDEGLVVENIQRHFIFNWQSFYASAWIDADVHKGKCMIRIKERK